MKRFNVGDRIRVVTTDLPAIKGWTGTVVQLSGTDASAYVRLDKTLPDNWHFRLPGGWGDNHIILYAYECSYLGSTLKPV